MSTATLSAVSPESPLPMLTSVTPDTPTLDPGISTPPVVTTGPPLSMDLDHPLQARASSLGPGPGPSDLSGGGPDAGQDFSKRTKPPPLHSGADWKVVLHLPEIEKWLRATSDRVTHLTHSVGQDSDNRHVDVHLVQLKDICEDISDHVEQIHALLETEFSLKLLSYSVNIIVDIRTVQVLWHQLRVSVLVLKERLLQGLQDPNGNFTRQTDILQAFSEDQHQTRLDALTDVDDCGQLTIRCSQDYFSLDCGITAFELSDYSPSDDIVGAEHKREDQEPDQESDRESDREPDQESDREPWVDQSDGRCLSHNSLAELLEPVESTNHSHSQSVLPTMQCAMPNKGESSKRPLEVTEVSHMQPTLPKKASLLVKGEAVSEESRRASGRALSGYHSNATLPSLVDPPDRSKFWLELDSACPEDVSQSHESLQVVNEPDLRRRPMTSTGPEERPQSSMPQDGISDQMEGTRKESHTNSEGDSGFSLPSPMREQLLSSDMDASGEESDPRLYPSKSAMWTEKRQGFQGVQVSLKSSPDKEHWYGSEEFLALPAQLRKTEMLALKLETLTQSVPTRCEDSTQVTLQDVDDWELTELNTDLDGIPPLLPPPHPYRRNLVSRFSPTSSSDIAPSLDESIESGPFSELPSEDEEGGRCADPGLQLRAPPVDGRGCVSLVQQLMEDIHSQDKDPDVWRKMESFKLNVESHGTLKESIVEEGRALVGIITSHQSALKDILDMVSSQWEQLQRQIRRQHGWMLRALRCIQVRLLYTNQSQKSFKVLLDASANQQPPCQAEGLKEEQISSQCEVQRAALERMAIKLRSLDGPSSPRRKNNSHTAKDKSLQEFEAEYQELWDWLMDMDAMVTDSYQLVMSEEQRRHLFKSSHTELVMMDDRRSSLLGRATALKRSGTELPSNFHFKMHNLTHTWRQLEKILSEQSVPYYTNQNQSSNMNTLLASGQRRSAENPRSVLSPVTNSLLEQLEARIKELKAWLRDTELLIFNSCLRQDKDTSEQLQSFKSLCSEIRGRRRGVSSVLKLCEKLLQQSQSGPMAEVGPDAEMHQEALQLLSINLERRWEAIVMQALQWQNRLSRDLGEQQVSGHFLEQDLVDLQQISLVTAGPMALASDDSWEWDETDITIRESEPHKVPEPDLTYNLPTEPNIPPDSTRPHETQPVTTKTDAAANQCFETTSSMTLPEDHHNIIFQTIPPSNNNVYQVYSLHNVEMYTQPPLPLISSPLYKNKSERNKQQLLLKSFSKDSSFSSIESLPDLLGGLMSNNQQADRLAGGPDRESEGERGSGKSENSRRSDCESGIMSDTGDIETAALNSDTQGEEENEGKEGHGKRDQWKDESVVTTYNQRTHVKKEKGLLRDKLEVETKRSRMEERQRRGREEAVEILINGHGLLTPPDSDSDPDVGGVDHSKPFMSRCNSTMLNAGRCNKKNPPVCSSHVSSLVLSQGSSLESLLDLGVDLFSPKDLLHRSASLESCLIPCHNTDGEAGGSLASLSDLELGHRTRGDDGESGKDKNNGSMQEEPSSGELSRRTLDLLKRLENIQRPLLPKMTRSVSDMTLRCRIPQKSQLPLSSSVGGRHTPLSGIAGFSWKELPSMINESSASLTELSSTEDTSLGSEDFTMLRNRHLLLDPKLAANANSSSYRKHCHNINRGGQAVDEADAASLSMVVNVSCTSACTDEDEEDSDLLSSSTLTLTEEELGIQDGEDGEEERLTGPSSGNEEDDEEEMEGSYMLGLEYMKRELQSWVQSPRTSTSSKTEAALKDELQCGSVTSSISASSSLHEEQSCLLNSSPAKPTETNTKGGNKKTKRETIVKVEEDENRRNAARSYVSQFVDDVENGNVDQICLKGKDEDDELLRAESGVFTKKGEFLKELNVNTKTGESVPNMSDLREEKECSSSPSGGLLPFPIKHVSSLVGQLMGELPCHSASLPSPPSLSPIEDLTSHHASRQSRAVAGGRKAITIQEKFKFSSFVTEKTRREVRTKENRHNPHSPCGSHPRSTSRLHPCTADDSKKKNVHDFVMEIIDMTSVALKSKENQTEEVNQSESGGSVPDQGPSSLGQIRDKVLEHSHRPFHLRKGDFYSYLSLSSHDSDCGEVSQCAEEKSSTPLPYSIPACDTPPPSLAVPSPEPRHPTPSANSAQSSSCSSPSLISNHSRCNLDLRFDGRACDADSEQVEEWTNPSLPPPPSPDIRDVETLLAACTEEVYLGPPLCYSVALSKGAENVSLKPASARSSLVSVYELNHSQPCFTCPNANPKCLSQEEPNPKPEGGLSEHELDENQNRPHSQQPAHTHETLSSVFPFPEPCYSLFSTSKFSTSDSPSLQGPASKSENSPSSPPPPVSSGEEEEKQGEDLCDVTEGEVTATASVSMPQEERSCNEGPTYLNPRAHIALIDSFAGECFADTKTLESNMGTIMTKISVSSSTTNPSKEPATTATRINPKINCSAMRKADKKEGERRGEVSAQWANQEKKSRKARASSRQEAKGGPVQQVSSQPVVKVATRAQHGGSTATGKLPSSGTKTHKRPPVVCGGPSSIQL
ncbi:A-kinase anchor protein 6 isoform X2 [Cololabis saira]|uniref:A-kinase anchor protein 6 isoform X2 n=1 Tax=Cololabis saira TaxID=129043 RepID=UPI002AD1DF76|nr:A-kinase anchor protein 6 isoform X2 [Cololabis saira]